ncbi:MAG: GNAT family N-acetyltransferase [Lysobacteraceae bacterium]
MIDEPALPQTTRLSLRRFAEDDLELLVRMHTDTEVMRFIGGVKSREESEQLLRERVLAYYDQHPGLGMWATMEKSSGQCIGMHLLSHIPGEAHIQVGYTVMREAWGNGYATEMCRALVRYGFETMHLPQVVAITSLDHLDSQNVLLKSGLRRNGERSFDYPAYAKQGPLAWFEASRDEWLAERASTGTQA